MKYLLVYYGGGMPETPAAQFWLPLIYSGAYVSPISGQSDSF